ncbi:Crp/Fnr family transcriptional regulator [Pedobacter sp. P351]|uniref:Crp/Fnr family transcriptional regulator n=1 Tax=Pedobacter superstes TaxID=3133441 RepID=UPI00309AF2DD
MFTLEPINSELEKLSHLHLSLFRDFLKKFISFTDEEWIIFAEQLYSRNLKKKDYFVEAGNLCTEVGFIIQGSLRCFNIKEGAEITDYFCLENDMISAYKSFLTGTPSSTSIEAIENTSLIIFSKAGLDKLLANEHINYKIERFGRLVAEYYLICYEDRVTSFVMQSPEERYLSLLKDNRNIIRRIPQHYIANFLGITPVSLSRIRKRIMEPVNQIRVS